MKPILVHAITLITTVCFAFIISSSSLAKYDIQITAAFFIIYFLAKKFTPKKTQGSSPFGPHRLFDSALFSFICVNLINSTGGLSSPLFFLFYFLIFAISLILEPVISLTTTATIVLLYLIFPGSITSFKDYVPLISLPFLTPFALFLGQEYQKVLEEAKIIQILSQKNESLEQEIVREEENTFLFLSLVIKGHLKTIKEAVENFMGDNDLKKIQDNVEKLEVLVDKFESDLKK